jgi:katanin p60 ATPase-containing subunit A1
MKMLTVWLRLRPQTTLLGELRQLGAAISQDIYQESPNVRWSDIAGLTDAKR